MVRPSLFLKANLVKDKERKHKDEQSGLLEALRGNKYVVFNCFVDQIM